MDQYTFLHTIGKGSYGEVFLVESAADSKQYVLKRIKLHSLSEKEKRAATQESRLLSELTHPNIVSYKDSFHYNGLLHIVMNYCEGGDLNRYLKARNSCFLSETKIIHWFIQIALALQYLHRKNILHRDLKTQNVFLSRNVIKLGDLGIARVLESSSAMARTFIGTPYYMSPEIFRNMPYNHKSDIWALGCCVVEMATLKSAFSARDMNSLAFKIIVGKHPSIPDNYSIHLKQMIKCLLARDPEQRPNIDQLLKLSFIRAHIKSFLTERRRCRDSGFIPENSTTRTLTPPPKSAQKDNDVRIPNVTDNETQNTYTISNSSDTFEVNSDEATLTTVSSYMDTTATLKNEPTLTDPCPNMEISSSSSSNSNLNDSQPERLLKNISITLMQESEKELKSNDIIEPNQETERREESLSKECSPDPKEIVEPKQSVITTAPPYFPQLINLSEFNSPPLPPSVNGCSPEVADSEARQRRREQKRQQNYSSTLMNRYLRKASNNTSPVTSQENSPIRTVEENPTESNSEPAEAKPCLKLCNEMPDSIDSDEEKMLTLLSSTLKVSDEVPIQVNTLHREWISRVRADSFDEFPLSDCEDFTEEDMQSNITVIEAQCKQGLGERLFLRSQILVDKYIDRLEELELNLKLILGEEKYPIYVTLLLKLKFYKQLCSVNFSS